MAALLGSAITAFLFATGIVCWRRGKSGQHGGSGDGATGVWQLCAQVAAERQREMEAEAYGRHALRRSAFVLTRSGDGAARVGYFGPTGVDDDPHG
ncbi:hypothetical protein AB0I53_04580 [Saccharopolyspora sp. NPDC050389]|uniref:hypothetical protein n=1 Tax=Saccharopolyspora sp. NPDC050389 TaxID=3155516 RepID=UPI0033E5CF19